ncbi:crotonase/enoyl-CoA hydratase family protein [Nocardioides massiliensis]|uniref:Enoyl-CoA hydratase/carnithine racemase n=1 Tax=Nocardioides massiliensis TaxID=1325935 RepID=A0ABT9NKN6_9ACTN|nr:crotonase/enoyl-CoA hydratase family protein [Nocardioides massiliensis]MDP9820784.1 enoyl-CoA hydratase/carnithine racemase [Nocardioides massiliensis]
MSDTTVVSDLLIDRADGLLVMTINRPHRRNAIDLPTANALAAALDELDDDPTLHAGVLTGAGGFFSSGMDLKAFAETGERPITRSRGGLGIVGRPPRKPVVAAVDGHVLGGGFEIALACDLIVSGSEARFALPEVKRGLIAAGGGAIRLSQRLPHHVAMEMLLIGEPLAASRALELGLVNRLVPSDQVRSMALELAHAIAGNAPLAVAATKQIVAKSRTLEFDEAYRRQEEIAAPVRASNDAQEGARAFAEKRPPVWRGR